MSTHPDSPTKLGDALVREIRVEMARHEIGSVRALAQLIGMNHVSLNDRMNRASRTGERVAMSMEDLARIAAVFDVEPWELVRRATEEPPPSRPQSRDETG